MQVPLAMQAGLYSSAISTSAMSVNSSMGMGRGFDAGLYASVPAVNSPKKVPTGSRQGTVGLMLWPKEGSNELAVTGTADGTSAHTSKLEVSSFLCADDSHNYSDLTPTCSRPCADLILSALPWKRMTSFPLAFETSLRRSLRPARKRDDTLPHPCPTVPTIPPFRWATSSARWTARASRA